MADSDWNAELYRRFEDERTRPARELLARVSLTHAARVYDLGCGPGNSTELLLERFPGAQDLIYANAALHWVPEHETLLPRLFDALAPGGVLAIQMPDNRDEPTHRLMREVATLDPWASSIGDAATRRTKVLALNAYYDLLARDAAEVDVWRTAYQHPMDTPAAIVDWVRSTGLRPFVDPLSPAYREGFLAEYERRIALAYLPRADRRLLLSFPRLFIVARRRPA